MTDDWAKRANAVLVDHGMTMDRISADAMRHVIEGVGKIAAAALADARGEAVTDDLVKRLLRRCPRWGRDYVLRRGNPVDTRSRLRDRTSPHQQAFRDRELRHQRA